MLTVLIGPPGAGKTTWARTQPGRHLATDDVREARFGDVAAHGEDAAVAAAFDADVLAAIGAGTAVIVENGANPRRDRYLRAARSAGLRAEVRVFENYEQALERALARAEPALTRRRWAELAESARAAASAVDGEGWDTVHRISGRSADGSGG